VRGFGVIALASITLLGGCGGDGGNAGSSIVDPSVMPPINSLEVSGADGLLLTTNRGFFRIEDGEATRIRSTVATPDGSTKVGTFLAVAADGEELIGSGHPDGKGRVADFLGLLRSADGGETWKVVSRYGIADLHVMHVLDGKLFAADAVLGGLLVSDDDGRSWIELKAPPEPVIDFVVDPADPDHLLASTEKEIFRSTDGGKTWSATVSAPSARLAWPSPEALRRADADGIVYASDDSGARWEAVEQVGGEPWKLDAVGSDQLYLALADGTILVSDDGGESWQEEFVP
jgi:photosystem II stability/assembly factor-like uncharacterized protein